MGTSSIRMHAPDVTGLISEGGSAPRSDQVQMRRREMTTTTATSSDEARVPCRRSDPSVTNKSTP